jgi:hypothetical protein
MSNFDKKAYMKEYNKKYRKKWKENPDNLKRKAIQDKLYREENKERIKAQRKAYREANRDLILEKKKRYYDENKEQILKKHREKAYHKRYRRIRPSRRLHPIQHIRDYYKATKVERDKISYTKAMKNYLSKPSNKIAHTYRSSLFRYIKVKNPRNTTKDFLGCTFQKLKNHLQSQFAEGMTWDNMGRGGWHIDHIIPCAFFDLTKPSHQKLCFNYKNLQPLWESDNCSKGDKIHWSIVLTLMINNYKTIGLN